MAQLAVSDAGKAPDRAGRQRDLFQHPQPGEVAKALPWRRGPALRRTNAARAPGPIQAPRRDLERRSRGTAGQLQPADTRPIPPISRRRNPTREIVSCGGSDIDAALRLLQDRRAKRRCRSRRLVRAPVDRPPASIKADGTSCLTLDLIDHRHQGRARIRVSPMITSQRRARHSARHFGPRRRSVAAAPTGRYDWFEPKVLPRPTQRRVAKRASPSPSISWEVPRLAPRDYDSTNVPMVRRHPGQAARRVRSPSREDLPTIAEVERIEVAGARVHQRVPAPPAPARA